MPVTLDELAIRIPASIQLFEKYGLDYYQNGRQTLREACESAQLTFEHIDLELSQLHEATRTLEDLSADRLIDYLNGRYHFGEKELLHAIQTAMQQLLHSTDGELYRKLMRMDLLFKRLSVQLTAHCQKEDELFFPWMRKLIVLHRSKSAHVMSEIRGFISSPVTLLESEHGETLELLGEIKKIADNYATAPSDPSAYVTLMNDLKAFETDLHMHLHIENNILFPKLIELEEELTKHLKIGSEAG